MSDKYGLKNDWHISIQRIFSFDKCSLVKYKFIFEFYL